MSKKQIIQFVVIIAVLALCIAGYFGVDYYGKMKAKKAEEESSAEAAKKTVTVFSMDSVDDISEFSYLSDGKELKFKRKEGDAWQYTADPDLKLDNDVINDQMLPELVDVTSQTVIEDSADSDGAGYGFDSPTNRITFTDADSRTHTFVIGAQNDLDPSIYYMRVDDDKKIYAVNSSISLAWSKTLDDIKKAEETSAEEAAS